MSPLAHEDRQRFERALARRAARQGATERVLRLVIRAWCRLVAWRLATTVAADLPGIAQAPGSGCVVVVAPHRAWVEPFLLVAAWPPDAARLVWLADGRTVTRSWWRRRLLPRLGVIPIEKAAGGPRRYGELAAEALARGHALAVFPEVGPASPPDRPRRISPGFAYLALRAGAPVIPVVVGGSHHIVRGSAFSLDFLEPIEAGPATTDAFSRGSRARAHALRDRYEAAVTGLLPARTAAADASAPPRDRWRWLATLLR